MRTTHTKIILFVFFITLAFMPESIFPGSRFGIDVEGGPVFATYNTVQVPNPGGTRFSLTDDFDLKSKIYFRLRLNYALADRHQLSMLYAPLTIEAEGTPAAAVSFNGTVFPAGEKIFGSYTFNSYRLTYRYKLVRKEKLDLWIGVTAKIRDAEIKLESSGVSENTENVGFVPLLNLMLDWKWSQKSGLLFEADALASPGGEGRAEDVTLAFYHRVSDKGRIKAGYRFVEGGADVESVYNFAFLHYFYIGFQLNF